MVYFFDHESARKFASEFQPSFPDPCKCRTMHAFGSYWSCQVEDNFGCPYKFGFGFEYLCKHEKSAAFAVKPPEDKPEDK